MSYAFVPHATAAYAAPVLDHNPAQQRLVYAREDHARCLQLAASYRLRLSYGERGVRELHDWAIGHARILRQRYPSGLSTYII
jgi:hypothetical protein